jgi:uncharacterized glyoxalase superfamily protein PhnB
MDFVKNVFKATEKMKAMREEGVVMHAEMQIGESTIMLADATEQFAPRPAGMFVYVNNADEAYAAALANGASPVMPPADMEYGRSCGVVDPFGNTWWPTSPPGN